MNRPESVGVVGWSLIIMPIFAGLLIFGLLHESESAYLNSNELFDMFLQAISGIVIQVPIAVYILKGKNWARYVFLALGIIGCLLQIVSGHGLLSIMIFIVQAYYLFTPKANEFFKRINEPSL